MKKSPLLAATVLAASASAEPLPMEHVLVSVPIHKKSAETALPVTVLSGEELRRAATSTLGDTLQNKPGLANASFGPGVGQPVIRGQQGPRVTVLQNGTTSADVSGLSPDHANSVEPLLADSIEILRGPATLLYGGGAIGGVVNVLDNRIPTSLPEQETGGIEYRRDSASDMDVGVARVDAAFGQVALHADGVYRDWNDLEIPDWALRDREEGEDPGSKNRIANTDGDAHSFTFGGSYHFDAGFAGLSVNRMENEYGIPEGAHGDHGHGEEHEDEEHEHEEHHDEGEDHDDEHEEEGEEGGITLDIEQTRYDGALHWHEPVNRVEVVRGFLTYTDYEHKEIEGSGEVGTEFDNDTFEGRLEVVHEPIGDFHGVFGLQARSGEFSAIGEEAFIPETDSSDFGIFLLEDYHRGDWTFEGGLRGDWVERKPDTNASGNEDFTAFSASGSALWDFAADWQLGLALSRAERAPSTEELFSNVEAQDQDELVEHAATAAIEIGDPELDTEVSRNADLSLRWQANDHFVDVTVFYNDFSDYIGLLNTGEEVGEVPVLVYAQDDAKFYGIELDSEFALAELAGGELRFGMFGDHIRGKLDDAGDVPRLPPGRVGSRLMGVWSDWEVWTRFLWADDQDKPGDNERDSNSYTRWDVGGEYRLDFSRTELLMSLEVKNLADEEIRQSTSFLRDVAPEPGRSVVATVRFTF